MAETGSVIVPPGFTANGDVKCTLYGFNFIDGTYLETIFISADTADLSWAFDAWRSVTRSGDIPGRRHSRPDISR